MWRGRTRLTVEGTVQLAFIAKIQFGIIIGLVFAIGGSILTISIGFRVGLEQAFVIGSTFLKSFKAVEQMAKISIKQSIADSLRTY